MRAKRWNLVLGLCALSLACSDTDTPSDVTQPSYAVTAAAANDHANQLHKVKLTVPVNSAIPGGTFVGEARITRFNYASGALMVSGVLNGVATIAGEATKVKHQEFTTTGILSAGDATAAGATDMMQAVGECTILHLDLGPIFLDVLGLQVDLSQVVLDITAVAGAGNLLGNLLCAVVNLLNGGLDLSILNQVLGSVLDIINALLG